MACHRRSSQSRPDRSAPPPRATRASQATRATVLLAAAAASAVALTAGPAGADPHEASPGGPGGGAARAAVERLYAQADRATERYDAAVQRTGRLRGEVDRIQDRVARGQQRVNRMRDGLGALAGAQYRSGSITPALALMLSADPDHYLDRATTLEQITNGQVARLRALGAAQRVLRQRRAEGLVTLDELARSRRTLARRKRQVVDKLARARQLLDALPPGERAAYDASAAGVPAGYRASGLPDLPPASSRAAAAFRAARRMLGAPYVWGQAGPTAFDCSGLTQWAYRQAGVSIPRTSQEQRHAGRQVTLAQARPGDLVVYRADASHVAMYAGHGEVIHAPHPGARVRYDPVDMMPISSITRI